jgi:hypothetical protein
MQNHWEIVNSGKTTVSNSAEELWQNAIAYFSWCDQNPIKIKRTITSGKEVGKQVETETPRPYSVKGLCLHCGILEEYLRDIRRSKDQGSLYYIVVSKIMYLIYIQNVELATVGVFNPIFTAKMLNIGEDDAPAQAITINVVTDLPTLSNSEKEVLEKLEAEKVEIK